MSQGWEQDKRWSDKFLPEIKRILGEHLIDEPPIEEDRERNTDLVVLRLQAVRIACRVRRYDTAWKYRDEFTLRVSRPNDHPTELRKVITGWGDYFFYGITDPAEESLATWFIGDLNVFRLWHSMCLVDGQGAVPGFKKPNRDGSSEFRAYKVAWLPDEFVVASLLDFPSSGGA